MGTIIYSFNSDISPKISYGMLEYVIELHAYDFVIKGFVMKKGCYCVGLYIYSYIYICNWKGCV